MLTYLFFGVFFAAYMMRWVWTNRRELKLSWQMPGLFPFIPFIGVAWRFFVQGKLTTRQIHLTLFIYERAMIVHVQEIWKQLIPYSNHMTMLKKRR